MVQSHKLKGSVFTRLPFPITRNRFSHLRNIAPFCLNSIFSWQKGGWGGGPESPGWKWASTKPLHSLFKYFMQKDTHQKAPHYTPYFRWFFSRGRPRTPGESDPCSRIHPLSTLLSRNIWDVPHFPSSSFFFSFAGVPGRPLLDQLAVLIKITYIAGNSFTPFWVPHSPFCH